MKNYYVSKLYSYSAWFLGFFGLFSGLVVIIHFQTFHPTILTSAIGFVIAVSWRRPYVELGSDIFIYHLLGHYEKIARRDIDTVQMKRSTLIIKTQQRTHRIPLFLLSSKDQNEISHLMQCE